MTYYATYIKQNRWEMFLVYHPSSDYFRFNYGISGRVCDYDRVYEAKRYTMDDNIIVVKVYKKDDS